MRWATVASETRKARAISVGGEAAEQPQRERDACVGREHRMAGGEDEPEEVVVERIVGRRGQIGVLGVPAATRELVAELARLALVHLRAADAIDRAVPARWP